MQEEVHNELWDRENRDSIKIDGQKIPDPKKHQIISFIKSGLRLAAGLIGAFGKFEIGFSLLFLAEIFGVYEELV